MSADTPDAANAPGKLRFAATPEARVAYRVDGSGPGLVMVHGTGADGETNWWHLVEDLARHRTVVRPDYSGSGQTRDHGGPLSIPMLARQVLAAADAAGLASFDLLGYSLGAAIAAHIAASHPGRLRKLVLVAGYANSADARLRLQFELWRRLIDTDRRALARVILLTGFSPGHLASWSERRSTEMLDLIVNTNDWEGMARQVELDAQLDIRADLPGIHAPTLVLGCRHDHMVPPAHARALAQAISGARYQELPAGHLAPLECPQDFLDAVLAFLLH